MLQGSLTVEASLILPIVLVIIFSVISFSLYINDVVSTNYLVDEYEIVENTDCKSINIMYDEFDEQLKKTLLIGSITNYTINNKDDVNKLDFEINFQLPFIKKKVLYKNCLEITSSSNRKEIVKNKVLFEEIIKK